MLRSFVMIFVAVIPVVTPLVVFAQTSVRDIASYSLKDWGLVLGMSLLGGLVNWWGQVRRGEVPITSISSLVGELCTSAFAGLLAFFICEWANFPMMLTAALTGICGHMGTRAVSLFEGWAERKFNTLSDQPPPK